MNELKIFESHEFGQIRTAEINGEVFFCGKDIATALGYSNTKDALLKHCREDGVAFCDLTDTLGRKQNAKFISEGNVYRLIAHSSMPNAVKFESWIFDEVLPTIHKHGAYMTDSTLEQALLSPDFLIKLATELKTEKEKRRSLEAKVEQDKPKVDYYEEICDRKMLTNIRNTAKELHMKQKELVEFLIGKKLLYRDAKRKLMPYGKYVDTGLFELKEVIPRYSSNVELQTMVTPKGKTKIKMLLG